MNNKLIVIIDSDTGNIGSLKRAIENFGINSLVTKNKEQIQNATHIILPGVGSFDQGMKKIHDLNIYDLLIEMANIKKIPFLGVCLGMQLLASHGLKMKKKQLGLI